MAAPSGGVSTTAASAAAFISLLCDGFDKDSSVFTPLMEVDSLFVSDPNTSNHRHNLKICP
jgi:hypothetical protein